MKNETLKKAALMGGIALMALMPIFVRQYFRKKKDPCDYSKKVLSAEVFRIRDMGNHQHDVFFILKRDSLMDTIAYSAELGHYASDAEIQLHKIDTGAKFRYVIMDRTKGDCDPHLEALLLDPYSIENK